MPESAHEPTVRAEWQLDGQVIWHLCPSGLHDGKAEDCPEAARASDVWPVNREPQP